MQPANRKRACAAHVDQALIEHIPAVAVWEKRTTHYNLEGRQPVSDEGGAVNLEAEERLSVIQHTASACPLLGAGSGS